MPFTFSHPAIVLPLIYLPKKWRSSTGLIIGSMAPDFEKFLRMTTYDDYSHTWRSIFYFNLPLAIILAFIYHTIIRDNLIDHLPEFLRKRLHPFKRLDWFSYFKQNYGIVILSIFIGTISHIAWDKVTHLDFSSISWLSSNQLKLKINNYKFHLDIIQYIASFLGGLFIMYFISKLPQAGRLQPIRSKAEYWILLFSITMVIVILKIQVLNSLKFLGHIIITTISAGLISLIITSWLISKIKKKQKAYTVL